MNKESLWAGQRVEHESKEIIPGQEKDTERYGICQQNRNKMSDHNKFALGMPAVIKVCLCTTVKGNFLEIEEKGDKILVESFSQAQREECAGTQTLR